MLTRALAMLVGTLAALWLAPFNRGAGFLLALPLLLIGARRGSVPLSWLAFGCLWAGLVVAIAGPRPLPPGLEGRDLAVTGRIATIPDERSYASRFVLEVNHGRTAVTLPDRLRLSWYGEPPVLRAGDRWRLTVRLQRPHGFVNPAGFDYERWLYRQGIGATGYVRASPENRRLDYAGWRLVALRGRLLEALRAELPDTRAAGLVPALALGYRGDIPGALWEVLIRTGTNHLVAISGLHVGMVFGAVFFLARGLWGALPRAALALPAPVAAALAGWSAALAYAALAGFAVPTRRALVMLGVLVAVIVLRRRVRPGDGLGMALAAVLLADPPSVLDAGFWLSFVAVAVILWAVAGRRRHALADWGRVQWAAAAGLGPLTLALFQRASLVAPLVNVVAVPAVAFAVLPLVLLGTLALLVAPALAGIPLALAVHLLEIGTGLLQAVADWPLAAHSGRAPTLWLLFPMAVGVAWLLAPRGVPGRALAPLLVVLPLLTGPPRPAAGTARVTLLDVGQGMALVVETRTHALLFDAGPRFSPALDAGEAAVVPFLRQRGIRRLDGVVISNGDSDHAGGLGAVRRAVATGWLRSGEPSAVAGSAPCVAGQSWNWDGVSFRVLHPAEGFVGEANDRSCVLLVAAGGRRLLVTGDIEAAAEKALLARGVDLGAGVITMPHHGSRSSSTPAFLDRVSPSLALVSVGYRNRYGHPDPAVVRRYRERGVAIRRTDRCGAITLTLGADEPEPECARSQRYPWRALSPPPATGAR